MQRGMEHQTSYAQPSRLQLLQANFQKKQLKEKEQKLLQIHQQNQRAAEQRLGRLTQHSAGKNRPDGEGASVRDYFKERNQQTQNGNINNNVMSPNQYSRQKKQDGGHYADSYAKPPRPQSLNKVTGLPPKKNSAGRDKSNPLAPIQREAGGDGGYSGKRKGSHAQRLAKESRTNSLPTLHNKKVSSGHVAPYSDGNYSGHSDSGMRNEDEVATSPHNLAKLKQQQRRKVKNQRRQKPVDNYDAESSDEEIKPKKQEKLSDFQKWQLEQDEARRKRLETTEVADTRKPKSIDFDRCEDGYDDEDEEVDDFAAEIARKERELMAQISKRQKELEKMQLDKEREEEEEAREEERRRKEEAAQEKRRRKIQAEQLRKEEEYQRRQEEEDEEEERRRQEEEEARKRQNSRRRQTPPDTFPTKAVAVKHKPKPPSQEKSSRNRRQPPAPPSEPEQEDDYSKAPEDPTAFYLQAIANVDGEDDGSDIVLRPCPNCGRNFNADRLQKHAKACKNVTKKRKVFDQVKMRTEGTDAEKYAGQINKQPVKKKTKVDFRKQHKEFIDAIRYAKKCSQIEAEGGNLRDLPPPPPSENPDYKQCPYCKRRFNPDTAERHIPKCKDTKARPAPPKRKR